MDGKSVFVTGGSGYIARHIILQLLQAGYRVKASVRSLEKGEVVRDTIAKELGQPIDDASLGFVALDLTSDEGWSTALEGADALLHTASPFPMTMPRDENDLLRPAVEGTLRALRAASDVGITRVVLTSSAASVIYRDGAPDVAQFDETDWTDPNAATTAVYSKSKVLAEKAAWDYVADHPEIKLTTVNPAFVMGPGIGSTASTSLDFIKRFLSGKDPMVPALMFDFVDVRDIARMHVAALASPASEGERLIGAGGGMWLKDVTAALKQEWPSRKIATRVAPNWLIRILAIFDKPMKGILPQLGKEWTCDNSKAKRILGVEFIKPSKSVVDTARYLIDNGHVR